MSYGNFPVPFDGTAAEAATNRATHAWSDLYGETRCGRCDSKLSHRAADYPCGTEPPRRWRGPDGWLTAAEAAALGLPDYGV